jgi:hypothetical protein
MSREEHHGDSLCHYSTAGKCEIIKLSFCKLKVPSLQCRTNIGNFERFDDAINW